MTNGELFKIFTERHPQMKVEDYRPLASDIFIHDRVGITIWLENGDIIEYFPKLEMEHEKLIKS